MENGDESAAEAALGLNPQLFVDEVHGIIADISAGAFEHCLQAAAAPGVLGAAKAAEKATDLQRGLNAIHHVVKDRLDKRMANWEKFCLLHCFDVPEGFVAAEDVDVYLLPQSAFPTGGLYFKNKTWVKQTKGKHVIIHNNYITGFEKKIKRFRDHGLWLVDEHSDESPLGRI